MSWEGLVMGVREIDRSLEQWQMGVKDLRRRWSETRTPSDDGPPPSAREDLQP